MGIMQTVLNALGLNDRSDQELGSFENDQEIGSFDDDRISWNPDPARPGETVEIEYRGLLQNSGADQVYLHYGFDSWNRSVRTVPMEKQEDGAFRASILAEGEREINFCFKDAGENWDNNNGNNWTLHLR
ncbi:MAG: carbohydrate-binding protein [Bacteroidota bacterium]